MDFSIIIPIYNVERYLRRCINSVLIQENVSFEAILIDDGSSDNCPFICDEYSAKDSRIHVIHKRHAGQGYARNSGLEIARGDYIFFLDSDDWIPEKTLESLKQLINKYDVDIISFRFIRTYETDYFLVNNGQEKVIKLLQPDIMEAYLDDKIASTLWTKLYKKGLFDCVKFSGISMCEDAYSMHLVLQKTQSLLITNQIYYVQYIRQGSLMQSPFSEKNFISIECGQRLLGFIDEFYPAYHYKALEELLRRQLDILNLIIKSNVYGKYRKQYLEIVVDIRSEMKIFIYDKFCDKDLYKDIVWMLNHPFVFIAKTKAVMIRERIGMARIKLCQYMTSVSRKALNEKTN